MELNERINALRKGKSLSQDALAEIVGVSRQAVSKWEKGLARPDIDNVVAMSTLFGVSTDYILTGQEYNKLDSIIVDDSTCDLADNFANEDLSGDVAATQIDCSDLSDNADLVNNELTISDNENVKKIDSGAVKKFSGLAMGISLFSIGLTATVIILIISAFTPNLLHTQYLDVNLDITFGMLLAISVAIAVIGVAVFAVTVIFLRKAQGRRRK
ncbi:MAG: helix-turn-helix domain-containing protein [Clostridia bacterium]|nr:helix-turn-helix domain-containing protein [Clostridia bacterium]